MPGRGCRCGAARCGRLRVCASGRTARWPSCGPGAQGPGEVVDARSAVHRFDAQARSEGDRCAGRGRRRAGRGGGSTVAGRGARTWARRSPAEDAAWPARRCAGPQEQADAPAGRWMSCGPGRARTGAGRGCHPESAAEPLGRAGPAPVRRLDRGWPTRQGKGELPEKAFKTSALDVGWAPNFELVDFTLPNEFGARMSLPGLTAVFHQLALAYSRCGYLASLP